MNKWHENKEEQPANRFRKASIQDVFTIIRHTSIGGSFQKNARLIQLTPGVDDGLDKLNTLSYKQILILKEAFCIKSRAYKTNNYITK